MTTKAAPRPSEGYVIQSHDFLTFADGISEQLTPEIVTVFSGIQDRLHEIAIGTTNDLFQKTGLYPGAAPLRIKCWPLAVVEAAVPLCFSDSLANLPRVLLVRVIT